MKKLVLIALLLASTSSYAAKEQVAIKSCNDGDTCKVVTLKGKVKTVRLNNIDAPEFAHFGWGKQPHAQESKDALLQLCTVGETATLDSSRKEKYGRNYGSLTCKGQDASSFMVVTGNAWKYKYSRSKEIEALETKAQEDKLGIWSKETPVDPYLWRKNKLK